MPFRTSPQGFPIFNLNWPGGLLGILEFAVDFQDTYPTAEGAPYFWDATITFESAGGPSQSYRVRFAEFRDPPDLNPDLSIWSYPTIAVDNSEESEVEFLFKDRVLYHIIVDGVLYTYLEDALGKQLVPFIIDYTNDPAIGDPPTTAVTPDDLFGWIEEIRNTTSPGAPYEIVEVSVLDSHTVVENRTTVQEVRSNIILFNIGKFNADPTMRITLQMDLTPDDVFAAWYMRLSTYKDATAIEIDDNNTPINMPPPLTNRIEEATSAPETELPAVTITIDIDTLTGFAIVSREEG